MIYNNLKKYVMNKSRGNKINQFYNLYSSGNVLDVGVTGNDYNDQINLFLKTFRLKPELYTGLSTDSMDELKLKYPGKTFIQYPGEVFPFKDNNFSYSFSNAVIEHVGQFKEQLLFLNEMLRVSNTVFFTTPNKFFPIESHTNTAFRHWFDKSFYDWLKVKHPNLNKNNLNLISIKSLRKLMESSNAKEYQIINNTVLGLTMTFTIICK